MADTDIIEVPDDQPFAFSERVWPLEWMPMFLEALAVTGVVTKACEIANISTSRVYVAQREHPDFASGWIEATARVPDNIEDLAVRYVLEGIPTKTTRTKKIYDNGEATIVEEIVEESTVVSVALTKFVLGRFKPEYRERVQHQHTGATGGAIEHDHVHEHQHQIWRRPTRERAIELAKLFAERGRELEADEHPVIEQAPAEPE